MNAKNVLSLLGGLAAGVVVGLLVAPEKGSVTRQKIVDELDRRGLKLSRERIDEIVEAVKAKIKTGAKSVEEAVGQIVDEARDLLDREREAAAEQAE